MKNKIAGATLLSLSDLLGKLISFLLLPYITLRLGATIYGQLTLYLIFVQILIIVISLSGQGLLPIKYVQSGEASALLFRKDNVFLSLLISLVICLFSILYFLFFQIKVNIINVLLIFFVSFVQSVNVINLSFFRMKQVYIIGSIGQLSVSVFNVLLTIVFFEFFYSNSTARLLAIFLSFLLSQLFYEYCFTNFFNSKDTYVTKDSLKNRWKEIISYGLSLLPHHGSFWIKSSIDRFFIAHYLSITIVGIYGLAIQLTSIVIIFFGVINQACQPFIYAKLKDKKYSEVKIIQRKYIFMVIICVVIYYFSLPIVFPYIFPKEFNDSIYYFNILLLGTIFHSFYFIFSHILFFLRKNKIISLITISSMGFHLVGLFFIMFMKQINVTYFCGVYVFSSFIAFLATFIISNYYIR